MTAIAIQGICGRMGHTLVELITQREDCTLAVGIDHATCDGLPCPVLPTVADLAGFAPKPDVLIDFSSQSAVSAALDYATISGLPVVICTTGLSDDMKENILCTSEKVAVFYSANMSLGVNLLAQLVKRAQSALPCFDIEIVEKHHRNKLDAPSGTALMLADAANEQAGGRYTYVYNRHDVRQKRGDDELGISAVRGGSIVGEHDVIFAGDDEVITLSHSAYSRNVFASGAVAAALFLAGKAPGLYTMQHLMENV